MESTSIFGLKVNNLSMAETLEAIDGLIRSGEPSLVVTLGVEMVMKAQEDHQFKEIVNKAQLVVPDSAGVLWACKKSGLNMKERVPGVDIIENAAKEAKKYPWRTFFLGAKPGIADTAMKKLQEKYPHFNCVGQHHGYFTPQEEESVIQKIMDAKTQLLCIALGFPRQEIWFDGNKHKLKGVTAMGVGGSFDVISGNITRAPMTYRKLGLEWLYRLLKEPSRASRMMALPVFALRVLFKGVN